MVFVVLLPWRSLRFSAVTSCVALPYIKLLNNRAGPQRLGKKRDAYAETFNRRNDSHSILSVTLCEPEIKGGQIASNCC